MELVQYLRLLKKWWWLIIIMVFIGGGISFIINTGRPPVYQAQTTIAIGRFIESPNPDSSQIRTGIELAQTYAQLVKTYDVLQGTIDVLNLSLNVDQLERLIAVRILTGTSLLVVQVTYTDPVLVADIANGLADQLVRQSPSNLTAEEEAQIAFANTQIEALNTQIRDSRLQLELVDSQLKLATDQSLIDRLTDQRNSIVGQINEATATLANFSNTIVTLQQRTNSIDIVEQARIPTNPSGSSVLNSTLLGGIVGVFLAVAIALSIEYLDETIRTTEEAAQFLKLPVLSGIVRFGKRRDPYSERLVTQQTSMSPVAESYRTLRTNLLYQGGNGRKAIYLVTSPGPGEGKSVTVSNLAVTMAQAGLQVLLIDGDLRRPRLHEVFGLKNEIGLTTLLGAEPINSDRPDRAAASLPYNLLDCLQFTALPKLWVITSGFIPANPTEILSSVLLQRWIDTFRSSSDIDVVLIDTPPCLLAADSAVLAATAKAEIVLVVDCGRTRRGAAARAKQQFESLGIGIKGIVVNRVNPRDENHSYGYYYGYGYGYAPVVEDDKANNGGRSWRRFLGGS
ncbi:MAG: polysaccharide biosynthesis tyrosine autokinase [Anaerolineae bacterium]